MDEGPATPGWEEAADALARVLAARGDSAALAIIALARAGARANPAARAQGFVEAAALLESAGDLAAALGAAERALEADPDAPEPWDAAARLALAAGERDRAARALLAVSIRCEGRRAADAALEAARLLDEAGHVGEATRALAAAAAADPGYPAVQRALAARARGAGDLAAAARHLAAVDPAILPHEERHEHARALAHALDAAHDARAERAWEEVFYADPRDAEAFERLASLAGARGDDERWLALAAHHEGALAGSDDVARRRDLRCQRARLHADRGDLAAAEGAWRAAIALDPRHRPALRALRALLERRGDWASVADVLAAEAAACDAPLEEAALLVEEARTSTFGCAGSPEGGPASTASAGPEHTTLPLAGLSECAPRPEATAPEAALPTEPAAAGSTIPGGPEGDDQLRAAAAAAEGGARAEPIPTLDAALERARAALLSDPGALEDVARAARARLRGAPGEARRLEVLARAAEGLAVFSRGAPPPGGAAAVHLTSAARESASPPAARGPAAQMLALLAPWLEALFPVDLTRRGISGQHRLGPHRAPELLALLDSAQRALGARPFAAFLSDAGKCEIALENTQPPALIISPAVARLAPGTRRFLVARALAHADLGGALAGKFAPRDLAILLELACRFAGGEPPPLGLPPDRAPAFLEALERLVPPTVKKRAEALAAGTAGDLARLVPRDLATALRRAASRIALLHAGGAGEAVAALVAGERRLQGLAPGEALAHPDLRDLADFALSDAYAVLRAAAEEPPEARG